MHVLLTGATGYAGLHVASQLISTGAHVRGMASRPSALTSRLESTGRFTFHQADLRNAEGLPEAVRGVDAVVHLAAVVGDAASARDPDVTRRVNVDATKVLFDAAERSGVRHLVFGSTCSVYGRHTAGIATEATPPNPISLYGESKVEAENYLLGQNCDVDVTVLRLATAYGVSPRMRMDLIVNQYAQQATTKGEITVMGPEAWRPHVHVQDVAQSVVGVLAAPGSARQQIFNVVTENMQLQQVAILAAQAQHGAVRISHRATVDDRRDYAVSGDKLFTDLRHAPNWTVAKGVIEVRDHLLSTEPSPQISGESPSMGMHPAAEAVRLAARGIPGLSRRPAKPDGPHIQSPPPSTGRGDHGAEL
ncbi:NAD-dependent epimerase/dehydratase family protein [Streptomyces brevispora]|uniref:NAD-dependent epimerase/dehydratase family protein n=1 Tax=Streptomyces brevispora TaxID=887462 RepID=UPI00371001CE